MTDVHAITVKSTGFVGGPGYTTFHFRSPASNDRDLEFGAVHNWVAQVKSCFTSTWSAEIDPAGKIHNAETGDLVEYTTCPTALTAAQTGNPSVSAYGAGVAGGVSSWSTNTINRARKIRGRSFLVPMNAESYDSNGTLHPNRIAAMDAGAAALMALDVTFVIWSRPIAGAGGALGDVVSHRVNDRAAFLTSRRQ